MECYDVREQGVTMSENFEIEKCYDVRDGQKIQTVNVAIFSVSLVGTFLKLHIIITTLDLYPWLPVLVTVTFIFAVG